jgi:hypothetical protein
MDPRETAIALAISDLDAGIYTSQRAAAKAYGIPRATLQNRLKGATNRTTCHQPEQRLSPEQEEFLVEWILKEDGRACPPSHARAREMATLILRTNGDLNPLGRKWLLHFMKRNPRVHSVVGKKIDAQRAEAATPEQLREFIEHFERTRQRLNIPIDSVYNMDETGVALGVCTNTRVLASSLKKKAYVKSPEDREWVSIIECVSATGQKLRCAIVFKGQHLQSTWFTYGAVPNSLYTVSENGWTSNAIGLAWLLDIFIPETPPGPKILLLDGHGSHISLEFQWQCRLNQIELIYLRPHTSHILQPLDLAPFSVIKSTYRNEIRNLASIADDVTVKKQHFIEYYHAARDVGLTERVIRAGWRATGLCPFNVELVLGSSQVLRLQPSTPEPQQPPSLIDPLYATPQKPQDIYRAQQQLRESGWPTRSTQVVLRKAGKALSTANTIIAVQQEEIRRLRFEAEANRPSMPRKRVRIDPGEQFANIENIMGALNQSAAEQARRSERSAAEAAEKVSRDAAAVTFDSMCFKWQLSTVD